MKRKYRLYLLGAACVVIAALGAFALYNMAQSLTANIITNNLKQAGYPQAEVKDVRIYMDGIVIGEVYLNENLHLYDLFTPQSAPALATDGVRQLIIRRWVQTVNTVSPDVLEWPFPNIERVSIEEAQMTLVMPLEKIQLEGTVKSLDTGDSRLALLMPFNARHKTYQASGKMEIDLDKGEIATVDINIEDGWYKTADMNLKRLNGWLNIQNRKEAPRIEAQIVAGAVQYAGRDFVDGTIQYMLPDGSAPQWTVTLNQPAQNYFNTWVIKPTNDDRYAIQAATQKGNQTATRTFIPAAPFALEPLE